MVRGRFRRGAGYRPGWITEMTVRGKKIILDWTINISTMVTVTFALLSIFVTILTCYYALKADVSIAVENSKEAKFLGRELQNQVSIGTIERTEIKGQLGMLNSKVGDLKEAVAEIKSKIF